MKTFALSVAAVALARGGADGGWVADAGFAGGEDDH